jgi:hypothetical protein
MSPTRSNLHQIKVKEKVKNLPLLRRKKWKRVHDHLSLYRNLRQRGERGRKQLLLRPKGLNIRLEPGRGLSQPRRMNGVIKRVRVRRKNRRTRRMNRQKYDPGQLCQSRPQDLGNHSDKTRKAVLKGQILELGRYLLFLELDRMEVPSEITLCLRLWRTRWIILLATVLIHGHLVLGLDEINTIIGTRWLLHDLNTSLNPNTVKVKFNPLSANNSSNKTRTGKRYGTPISLLITECTKTNLANL